MKCCFADTRKRMKINTNKCVNSKIKRKTLENIEDYTNEPDDEIRCRIAKLNKEWDVEKLLQANAGAILIFSYILGTKVDKKWFSITGIVGGFLLQHAFQGWCPASSLLRQLGIRNCSEIDFEKEVLNNLLKVHRG
ncbi:DUF2892 domain-containing protein [Clostridium sp. SHJSY1]|uniref:YgaP family membrane protein n=1 Tax=Clostridium sp. SHJSY1 TaxID=2942483 RepID=UPI00287453D0|nr:DUF2892 domain-containing protein [Clostridium sp. SHJSY1]MDS0528067.1 DUF2892 domain-containing protein [Clostridium sp. SHJSY1]